MGRFADILGTMAETFRIGQATLDASGLSYAQTFALPDVGGGTLVVGGANFNVTEYASYIFQLADANTCTPFHGSSPMTATIPAGSSVAFPYGTILGIRQDSTGTVTFAGASGVTLNAKYGASTNGVGDWRFAVKSSTSDEWDIL